MFWFLAWGNWIWLDPLISWSFWCLGSDHLQICFSFRCQKRNFCLVDITDHLWSAESLFLGRVGVFFVGRSSVVKCDADTRRHDQHENGAHLLVPDDDKVKWKSVSRYSTWKQRYQWLGRLIPRCSWPRRCWAFYVPSHLHVGSGAFTSAAFLLKTGSQRY